MTSLKVCINSLNLSGQLVGVKDLIDTAQAATTFWGSRVIEIKGYTGSVYLDDIAGKITEIGRQRSNADDLLPVERIAGVEIVNKLEGFYRVTDAQIHNSNFFTRFLNWIREFSFSPYTTRFYTEETAGQNFRAYSENKFLQEFGGFFDSMQSHPASDGSAGLPLRIFAKEDRIRQLLFLA